MSIRSDENVYMYPGDLHKLLPIRSAQAWGDLCRRHGARSIETERGRKYHVGDVVALHEGKIVRHIPPRPRKPVETVAGEPPESSAAPPANDGAFRLMVARSLEEISRQQRVTNALLRQVIALWGGDKEG